MRRVNGNHVVKKNKIEFFFALIVISSILFCDMGCNGPVTTWEKRRLFLRVCTDEQVVEAVIFKKPISQCWMERFISDKRILRDPISSFCLLGHPSLDKGTKNRLVEQGYGYSYIDSLLNWNRGKEHDINEDMIQHFLQAVDNDDGRNSMTSGALVGILRTPGYSTATYQKCWRYYKKYCLSSRLRIVWLLWRSEEPGFFGVKFNGYGLRKILSNKSLPISIQQEAKILAEKYHSDAIARCGGFDEWVNNYCENR